MFLRLEHKVVAWIESHAFTTRVKWDFNAVRFGRVSRFGYRILRVVVGIASLAATSMVLAPVRDWNAAQYLLFAILAVVSGEVVAAPLLVIAFRALYPVRRWRGRAEADEFELTARLGSEPAQGFRCRITGRKFDSVWAAKTAPANQIAHGSGLRWQFPRDFSQKDMPAEGRYRVRWQVQRIMDGPWVRCTALRVKYEKEEWVNA